MLKKETLNKLERFFDEKRKESNRQDLTLDAFANHFIKENDNTNLRERIAENVDYQQALQNDLKYFSLWLKSIIKDRAMVMDLETGKVYQCVSEEEGSTTQYFLSCSRKEEDNIRITELPERHYKEFAERRFIIISDLEQGLKAYGNFKRTGSKKPKWWSTVGVPVTQLTDEERMECYQAICSPSFIDGYYFPEEAHLWEVEGVQECIYGNKELMEEITNCYIKSGDFLQQELKIRCGWIKK